MYPRGADGEAESFPVGELEHRLEKVETPKALCVVIMGKFISIHSEFEGKVNQVERLLRRLGWRRVVIQVASALGQAIYRE